MISGRAGRLAILLALGVAGCTKLAAAPAPATGHARPAIVSLNPCLDAVLVEIAAPGQVLAISHYSRDPGASSLDAARAAQFRTTGGTVEEIIALAPDLVVAGQFLPPATRSALERLGIRVETFGSPASVEESHAQSRRIAALAGAQQNGEALIARIDRALAEAAPLGAGPSPRAVLWQPGGLAAADHTLVAELLARAGFARMGTGGQGTFLTLEEVLADPPDILLVAGTDRAQHHPALAAVPHMRRAEYDPSLLWCGGPTIIRAAQRLAAIRHPGRI